MTPFFVRFRLKKGLSKNSAYAYAKSHTLTDPQLFAPIGYKGSTLTSYLVSAFEVARSLKQPHPTFWRVLSPSVKASFNRYISAKNELVFNCSGLGCGFG